MQGRDLSSLQPPPPRFKHFSASASQVTGTTGVPYHAQLMFVFLVEPEFHHVGQAGLELMTSTEPLTLASQSAGITGVNHHVQPEATILELWSLVKYLQHPGEHLIKEEAGKFW